MHIYISQQLILSKQSNKVFQKWCLHKIYHCSILLQWSKSHSCFKLWRYKMVFEYAHLCPQDLTMYYIGEMVQVQQLHIWPLKENAIMINTKNQSRKNTKCIHIVLWTYRRKIKRCTSDALWQETINLLWREVNLL